MRGRPIKCHFSAALSKHGWGIGNIWGWKQMMMFFMAAVPPSVIASAAGITMGIGYVPSGSAKNLIGKEV
jgi:hypothetical protein